MGLTLTILFDDPFWVGLFERRDAGSFEVARVVFGAEPSDALVWQFVRERYSSVQFARLPPEAGPPVRPTPRNPKRAQREAARAVAARGPGTRAQAALKLAHEAGRVSARAERRRSAQAEADRRFALRQEHRKAKHRGR